MASSIPEMKLSRIMQFDRVGITCFARTTGTGEVCSRDNHNLFALKCHFRIEGFQGHLLTIIQVFYSAETTYPITVENPHILNPEKSRRGRADPSIYRLHMG